MRLIRITSREPTATFDSTFNENLILPPNSKIALQSVSAGVERKDLVVDGTNNEIQYQIATGVNRTVFVPAGQYRATNTDDLLRYITRELNKSCDFRQGVDATQKMLGIQWLAEKNKDKKVSIGYRIGRYGPHKNSWAFTNTSAIDALSTTFRATEAINPTTDNSRNCILPYLISRGNGFIRCRTGSLLAGTAADQEGIGYIIGLTDNLDATGADLETDDFTYAIHVTIVGGQKLYRVYEDGVHNPTYDTNMITYVGDDVDNEHQEVTINGGTIDINIYRTGTNLPTQLATYQITDAPAPPSGEVETKLRPFFVFRGGNVNSTANFIRATPSPYGDQPPDLQQPDIIGVGAPPRPPAATEGANFIFFESAELSDFLGYNKQRIPPNGTIQAYEKVYIADSEFPIPQEADAFLVLLDNLQLDSYDSYSSTQEPSGGQRKNLLTVIPSSNETGTLVYEPSYPTFINLNNQNPIFLRNIKARILRNDYSAIDVQGLSSMVLLIDN